MKPTQRKRPNHPLLHDSPTLVYLLIAHRQSVDSSGNTDLHFEHEIELARAEFDAVKRELAESRGLLAHAELRVVR